MFVVHAEHGWPVLLSEFLVVIRNPSANSTKVLSCSVHKVFSCRCRPLCHVQALRTFTKHTKGGLNPLNEWVVSQDGHCLSSSLGTTLPYLASSVEIGQPLSTTSGTEPDGRRSRTTFTSNKAFHLREAPATRHPQPREAITVPPTNPNVCHVSCQWMRSLSGVTQPFPG